MNELSRLVKPYYTVDETFNRLIKAGAHLDKIDDIYLLIRNNMLKVSLLLDQHTTLIKADFARPYDFGKSLDFDPGEENFDFFVSTLKHTESEAKQEIHDINYAKWMIPDFLRTGSVDISTSQTESFSSLQTSLSFIEKAYKANAIKEVSPDKPIVVTPMIIHKDAYDKNLIKGIYEYDFTCQPSVYEFFNQAAVHWNNQGYFVCKSFDSFFIELVNIIIELSDTARYQPTYALDTRLIPTLIKSNNFVVTKEALQAFEQEYLDIDHGVTHDGTPEYINPNSDNYAEELDIAIQAHTAIFKEKYGNPYQSNTDRITSWLMKNYPDKCQSDAFLRRIRSVVLPKK